MTFNAVALLMGKKIRDWKGMQKWTGRSDFIPSVLKFDTNKVKEKTRKKVEKKYLRLEDFNYERVNKASKVAGPLVLWVKAQVKFSYLLDSVEPWVKEIKVLKSQFGVKQNEAQQLSDRLMEFMKLD